jgi:hypothetical protein
MGDLVVMNSSLENNFAKKLFLPFTILEFTLTGTKSSNSKTNSSRILIVIVENDQPSLQVSFP